MVKQARGDRGKRTIAGKRHSLRVEMCSDQLLGLALRLAGERRGQRGSRAVTVGALAAGELRKQRVEGRRTPKIMTQLEPPALGQAERIDQRVEQSNVAEAQGEALEACAAHGLDGEQHDLGVGLVAVGDAETLDAGLAELALASRPVRLEAEGRAIIAIARLRARVGVALEIKPRHRHGQVRPEAQLVAREVGEHISEASHLLADPVEEHVGRLEDRRRNLLVARPLEQIEQGRRLGFESLEFFRQFSGHGVLPTSLAWHRHARPCAEHPRISCHCPV